MTSPWTFGDESANIGAGTITLVKGRTFAICDRAGDASGRGVQGLFLADTRLCSTLAVLVDGRPVEALAVSVDAPSVATFVGRSADRALIVRRRLRVGRGAALELEVRNRTQEARAVDVGVVAASDLAGVFAVKEGRADLPPVPPTTLDGGSVLAIGDPAGERAALVQAAGEPADVDPVAGVLRWRVELPPAARWVGRVDVLGVRDGAVLGLDLALDGRPRHDPDPPSVRTDVTGLACAVERAIEDLDALRLVDPAHPEERVVAAGAPWFMTLFGRDSILASWMALPFDPGLALDTVRALARLQGTRYDAETEEEPGRIVHELRFGTRGSLALGDAERYYGTADATPLFVLLVHELWRWGLPWPAIEPLLPAVDAALRWVETDGDPDGDGFVEYRRATEHGLVNQGWKDSWDAISFAGGELAEPPIALAEVQAYAYAAWRAGAALAREAGDHVVAAKRDDRASLLRHAFDEAYWVPERGWYAMALDGAKRPVDALASNLGHLLWCGIVPRARVPAVASCLVSAELASGWGLRTLATSMARYDPLGYHTGSVWPHDTAIAVAGLRRAGCAAEASRLATDLLAAAEASGGRLPELFAGLTPDDVAVPAPYPASCSPQAWASAAPLLVLRALLGLEPDAPGGQVVLDPVLPVGASRLHVDGVRLAGSRVAVEVDGEAVAVRGLPSGVAVLLRPSPMR